jgi:hypothetical protein
MYAVMNALSNLDHYTRSWPGLPTEQMDLDLFRPSDVAAAITNHAEAGVSFSWLRI